MVANAATDVDAKCWACPGRRRPRRVTPLGASGEMPVSRTVRFGWVAGGPSAVITICLAVQHVSIDARQFRCPISWACATVA